MRLVLCVLLLWTSFVHADARAVVKIPSHGCSGVVVQTQKGRTWVLTCAHAFETPRDRLKRIVIDAPAPAAGAVKTPGGIKIVKIDHRADLCLLCMHVGPLPYVCHVSLVPPLPRTVCKSVGYDLMKHAVDKRADVVGSQGNDTFTTQRPVEGRSGGGLINPNGRLVGICSGYEDPAVFGARSRGIYVSHATIWTFMGWQKPAQGNVPMPRVLESRSPQ